MRGSQREIRHVKLCKIYNVKREEDTTLKKLNAKIIMLRRAAKSPVSAWAPKFLAKPLDACIFNTLEAYSHIQREVHFDRMLVNFAFN